MKSNGPAGRIVGVWGSSLAFAFAGSVSGGPPQGATSGDPDLVPGGQKPLGWCRFSRRLELRDSTYSFA
jgi:hypothetical protein